MTEADAIKIEKLLDIVREHVEATPEVLTALQEMDNILSGYVRETCLS